jgi:hypothetical protein
MQLVVESNEAVRMGLLKEKGADRKLSVTAKRVADELDRLKEKYHRDETGEMI